MKTIKNLSAICFWLIIWEIAARYVAIEIFIPLPSVVFAVLIELMGQGEFYISVFSSLLRILLGFSLGVVFGITLAILTTKFKFLKELFYPLISLIKATPVASFIILTMLWIESKNVSIFISFLMVLPIIWSNVSAGIESTDEKLLEMSKVFNFSKSDTIRYIYIPECRTYFYTACIMAIGFAWKSGIAAEVLSTPKFSIGKNLYYSKIYLETPQLFAWTIVVVILSIIVEKIFKKVFELYK